MGRGIGVGLFSPWVFDRVRQDHRWGGVGWGGVGWGGVQCDLV